MKLLITIVFVLSCFYLQAQQDTLYVFYENIEPNYVLYSRKHKNDPNPINHFPFNGGGLYIMPKQVGNFKKNITFSFNSYTPEWMDLQFYYQKVDKSILNKKDFKTKEWFDKATYTDIIKYFGRTQNGERVIMLLDENHIDDEQIYLVRVYFDFDAEE